MKDILKLKLSSLFERLEDARIDKERVLQAEKDCIRKKGYIGCWNCNPPDRCAITETKTMVDCRIRLLNATIVREVEEWLGDAE
jgi:hypothetical protein